MLMTRLAQGSDIEIFALLANSCDVHAAIRAFAAAVFGALVAVIAIAVEVHTDEENTVVGHAELAVVTVAGRETLRTGLLHTEGGGDDDGEMYQAWLESNVIRAAHTALSSPLRRVYDALSYYHRRQPR
jgi:hypothetical protein